MKNTATVASLFGAFYASLQFTGGIETLSLFSAISFLIVAIGSASNRINEKQQKVIAIGPRSAILMVGFIWIILSIPLSTIPGNSFQVGASLICLPLSYFAVTLNNRNERVWTQSFFLIKILAAGVMILAIGEFALLRNRPSATFLDPNLLAAFCNALVIPAISRAFQESIDGKHFRKIFLGWNGFFVLAGLTCLATTSSRGGLISFSITAAALTLILARRSRFAFVLAGFIAVILISSSEITSSLQFHHRSLIQNTGTVSDQSIGDRIEMLRSAWMMYSQHPLKGIGIGTYKVLYSSYRNPKEITSSGNLLHNDYAQFLLEGGPLLACILLALAVLSSWQVWSLWSAPTNRANNGHYVEAAGLSCGLLGLFIHAIPNFIFYSLPLSILAGFYFARLNTLIPINRVCFKIKSPSNRTRIAVVLFALVFATGTLGVQAGFVELTAGKCQLEMCSKINRKSTLMAAYASLLAATQPSYLPARNWLITAYTTSAKSLDDPKESLGAARLAARELSEIILRTPTIGYPYRQLGELIQIYPASANVILPKVPHDPLDLFREAVERDPLDVESRLKLAGLMEQYGMPDQAFSLVFEDGMRWWRVHLVSDSDRLDMLNYAIPLALKLRRCKDALEMAHVLLLFKPDDSFANEIVSKSGNADSVLAESGCLAK